jgi:hypothetical protein
MNNILTASRLNSLLACPRQHYWKHECGLCSTGGSHALRFGSAWARALEQRWNGLPFEDCLANALAGSVFDEHDAAMFSGLLSGYFMHWQGNDCVNKIYPEAEFNHPLNGSRTFAVGGKIDGLGVDTSGCQIIVESKTTSDSVADDSDYWLRLRWNLQLLQYVTECRAAGWKIERVIYDVTRKPAIRPTQIPILDENKFKIVRDVAGNRMFLDNGKPRQSADKDKGWTLQTRIETPDEFYVRLVEDCSTRPDFYFARREVPILGSELQEFEEQRLNLSRSILYYRQSQKRFEKSESAWPRNVNEFQCRGCSFSGFCLQGISPDLTQPMNGFEICFNPELSK